MILDEYKIAEKALAQNMVEKKADLFIVAKYLRHEVGCNVDEAYSILSSLLSKSFSQSESVKTAEYLIKMAKQAENFELRNIEFIGITSQELEKIRCINDLKKERILFSLLIYAKFNNALSTDNNNWCNIGINDLYKTAKVSTRNTKERAMILNRLKNNGYISFSCKNTNLNIRCEFVDDKTDYEMVISDLRELGYQYLNIDNAEWFTYCKNCGVIIKKKSKNDHSTRYCSICSNEKRIVQKRNSFQKLDKANMSPDGLL